MGDEFKLLCATPTGLAGGAQEILAVPAGHVTTSDGDTYLLDRQAANLTIARFREHGVKLPIDIEHSTIHKGEVGEPAPAVGWIDELAFNEQRGLFASVQWTDKGRKSIQDGEVKYASPVIAIRKSDGRVVALHSIGLTNKPAIAHMPELIAASEHAASFLKSLRQPEGGPTGGATPDAIGGGGGESPTPGPGTTAAAAPKARASLLALLGQIRDLLSLGEGASLQDVYEALGEFIQAAGQEQTDTATLRQHIRAELEAEREVDDAIATYIKNNRLPPGNEQVMSAARTLARRDLRTFRSVMDAVAPFVATGRITPKEGAPLTTDAQQAAVKRQAQQEWTVNRAALGKWTTEEAFIAMRVKESQKTR